jgi:hypothetical protein
MTSLNLGYFCKIQDILGILLFKGNEDTEELLEWGEGHLQFYDDDYTYRLDRVVILKPGVTLLIKHSAGNIDHLDHTPYYLKHAADGVSIYKPVADIKQFNHDLITSETIDKYFSLGRDDIQITRDLESIVFEAYQDFYDIDGISDDKLTVPAAAFKANTENLIRAFRGTIKLSDSDYITAFRVMDILKSRKMIEIKQGLVSLTTL